MRYLISYELNSRGRTYTQLTDALWSAGGQRILSSQWIMRKTSTNATTLRDYFWQFMDQKDRLLVASIDGNDWACIGLMVDLNTV